MEMRSSYRLPLFELSKDNLVDVIESVSEPIYLHSIILWMIKNFHSDLEPILQKSLSQVFGSEVQVSEIMEQAASKAGSMQFIASRMIETPLNHVNALKGFYQVFIDQVNKSYFPAVEAIGSLLFIFISNKNISEVIKILLREKNFTLLTLWMIGHDIHPYQVISSVQDVTLNEKLINRFWSKQGILQYMLRRLLLEGWSERDERLFLIPSKSDKYVFNMLLNCLADINTDPERNVIISQLLSEPDASIQQRVAKIQTYTPATQHYFNDLFKRVGLAVRIGERVSRVSLDDCAIMHMLGFKKIPSEFKDQPLEFEEQPVLLPMLNPDDFASLALVNRHYYHIVNRSPKDPVILEEMIKVIKRHIIENQQDIDHSIRLISKINSIINKINQEINSKRCYQHRSWPVKHLVFDACCFIALGLSLYGSIYSFNRRDFYIDQLKHITPYAATCYDVLVKPGGSGRCREDEWDYYEKCKDACYGLDHALDIATASFVGLGAAATTTLAGLIYTLIGLIKITFRNGPERLQDVPLKGYSRKLQTEVKEVSPENFNHDEPINQVNTRMTAEVTRLTQQQQEMLGEKHLLPGLHSLFVSRFNLFKPKDQVGSSEGLGLEEFSQVSINIDDMSDDMSQQSSTRGSRYSGSSDELRVPLLQNP